MLLNASIFNGFLYQFKHRSTPTNSAAWPVHYACAHHLGSGSHGHLPYSCFGPVRRRNRKRIASSIIGRCLCLQTVVVSIYVALEDCNFLDEAYSFDLFLCQVNFLKGSSKLRSYASSYLFDSVNKKKKLKTT